MAEREDENAYEKLSREVHQAQTTGAIHPDWLENPCGFLLKPDFKRKMQHMGAGGKKLQTSIRGLRLHLPGSSYRSRWFVLDGMMLRYFRSKNDEQELGAIHLTSVNAVLPSSMADAPDHALDLVCADRIYTVAAATREDMVRWATVLTLVLRGEYQPKLMQRRESAVIRGSSVIPPHNGRGSAVAVMRQASQVLPAAPTFQPTLTPFDEEPEDKEREMDAKLRAMSVREKIITVTFDTPGPLHLLLQSTMEDTIMVRGFQEPAEGGVGLAEATGIIMLGDILVAIQDHAFSTLPFATAIEEIQRAARPLTLRFSRLEAAPIKQASRLAQGWVLAKEPATNRVRIRLLQLQGSKLHLFKSGLHIGRQDRPVLTLSLDDVTDLRPLHDKRSSATCVQGFPKTFGLTLEAGHFMFTCYVLSLDELKTWVDVLKNAIVFEKPRAIGSTIPVHPMMVIEKAADTTTVASTLLASDALKWGELTHVFEGRHLVLRSGGKLQIFLDASQTVLLGTLRCDAIVALTPSELALGGDEAAYQLKIGVVIASNNVHWRRTYTLRFESIHVLMKWARYLEREVRHSAGRELDVTLLETSVESLLLTSSGPRVARYEPQDEYVRWVASSRGCRHFGQLRIEGPMAQGWFYVKKPGAVGADAYHPRFVVLKDHYLLLHKYETTSADVYAGRVDLAEIRTVRVVKGDSMEAFDFSIQLKTSSNLVFTLAALTQAQRDAWFMLLLWASDYYFQETPLSSLLPPPKLVSSTSSAEHVTNRLSIEVVQNAALATTSRASLWAVESIAQIRGWLTLADQRVYAAILNGVLSYYEVEDDLDNEWGDALDAIELSRVTSVSSDGDARFAVVLALGNGTDVTVHLEAMNAVWAKKWMLAMCSCSRLVLLQDEAKLFSTAPKEGYLWKLDRLYQVHRKRFFCLQNHELVVSTTPDGRVLNVIALDAVAGIFLSKIAGDKDYFQMHLHCVHDAEPDPTLTVTALVESDEDMDSASFQTISVSFFDEAEMREWALAVYHCCTNAMINHAGANLQLPSTIETFPQALMKTTAFLDAPTDESDEQPSNAGWLFYRSGVNERYRRRFFVLRGFELSIYKHDLGADEIAIRYGVVDVRSVVDVQFVSRNCPENAIELAFSTTTLTLIPPSDAAAVYDVAWRTAFLNVKRSVVTNHDATSGVLISRSSTFALQKENEELLRTQIETLVSFAANLLAYDGSKWVANYYVMTAARLLVFSLAVHLYDEDPDLLSTLETKHIVQVRSLTLDEEAERSGSNSGCAFLIQLSTVPDPLVLKCETFDHCLQWMRMLCHSNGKLELKRNAATGVWGSVNRIASLSRHNSFLAAGPPRFSEASSGRLSRQEAMRRRTSELLQSRQSMTAK